MRVRCVHNTGNALRPYEYKDLQREEFGRFGASGYTEYGELEIGKEYLVMGMIMFESCLSYLIDDNHMVSACPCQLFEIVDNSINSNWHLRLIGYDEDIYPFVQAIWGYYELCYDKESYAKLIVEHDDVAIQLYFKRKTELVNHLSEDTL